MTEDDTFRILKRKPMYELILVWDHTDEYLTWMGKEEPFPFFRFLEANGWTEKEWSDWYDQSKK